jgi:N-acetylglucosamine kinase-like BadF-type ATPase
VGYVLGVDAGNTKTIALVAHSNGAIFGAGRGGCGDIYGAASEAAALAAVTEAVEAALAAASVRRDELAVGYFSLAGADWPEDFAFLHDELSERGFGRTVHVVNDAIGALRAGSPDGTGVVVAPGTGIAVGARAPDGRTWHTSFWAEPHGALELGRLALRAVLRAELGIDPPTGLTAEVLEAFGRDSVEELLHQLTARDVGTAPRDITRLARVLLDEACRGDVVARRIVEEQGTLLGEYAVAAARKVGIDGTPFWLVLTGGVFRHSGQELADALLARVRLASPGVRPIRSRFEPAIGAVFLALEAAGVAVDAALQARLEPTIPPGALFAT